MLRDDYLMRMIDQIAAVIGRMIGLRQRKDYTAAIAEAERGWDILGVRRELVDVLETPTLAELLRTPQAMRVAADLLIEEARALWEKGDPLAGRSLFRRAYELYLEARAIEPLASDDATLIELGRFVPPELIDARYRS